MENKENNTALLDNKSVFTTSFQNLNITDDRDIRKIAERKKNKCRQPFREELYTYNPFFNGKYKSCQCDKCNDD